MTADLNLKNSGVQSSFGKKNKTPQENAACFLVNIMQYISAPDQGKLEKKFLKYLARIRDLVFSETNEVCHGAQLGCQVYPRQKQKHDHFYVQRHKEPSRI